MRKIKKYVVWFCIVSMLLLAGCGGKTSNDAEPTKKVETPAKDIKEEQKPSEEAKSETTEEKDTEGTPEASDTKEPTATKEPIATEAPAATKTPEVTAQVTPTATPEKEVPKATATPIPAETGEKFTVVIPNELTLCETEETLKQYAKENNLKDAVIDAENLTITVQMTITEKVEFIKLYRKNIENTLRDLIAENDYKNIVSFEVSEDFTEFNFYTTNEVLDNSEASLLIATSYIALADAEFNGGKCAHVAKIVNADTKAEVFKLNMSEFDGTTAEIKGKVITKLISAITTASDEKESNKDALFKNPDDDTIKVFFETGTEKVVLDNEKVTVKIGKPQNGDSADFVTPLYVKNKTNETLIFELSYTAVNMLADKYPSFGELSLAAGEEGVNEIGWYISPFSFEDVDSLEFALVGNNEIYEQKIYQRFEIDLVPENQVRNFEYAPALGEIVVLDNEYITFIAGEMEQGDFISVIPYYVKNKTAADLYLNEASTVIDGFMMESLNDIYVPAGMGVMGEIGWFTEDLEERGISRPAEIEINYQTAILTSHEIISDDKLVFKPLGDDAIPFDGYEFPSNAKLLVDDEKVKIYAVGFDTPEYYFGFEAKLYIENKTDKNLIFMSNSAELNKVVMDSGFLFCNVNAGKRAITTLSFTIDEMEGKNIGTVNSMAFTINAVNADNYFGGNVYEKSFSIEVEY